MKEVTRLFLVRHGEVEAKYQKVFGGRIDMELSPKGVEQAECLGRYLGPLHMDAVYVSPLRRARRTALAVQEHNGHVPVVVDELREVDFGAWTGLHWQEVLERHGVSAFDWLSELERGGIPEAEPLDVYAGRTLAVLQRVLANHAGGRVALVCHGGVIRMLLAHLVELPLSRTVMFEVDYASVSVVDHCPGRTEIQLLNYTPWRPAL